MSICLCHDTADSYLEVLAHSGAMLEAVSSSVLADCGSGVEELLPFVRKVPGLEADWPDVLVSRDKDRRSNKLSVCHKWSGCIPEGSILGLDEGLYISSPAFCLLQQASCLSIIELCQMLGRYLGTASMARDELGSMKLKSRKPLINEEDLSLYLAGVKGQRGVRMLREALRFTCAGAASPQEANLQLLLTLPPRLGGFGLPHPIMNYLVESDGEAHRICPKDHYRIDLCWPDISFGLEYQGEEHEETIGADYARFYALRAKGYEVWYVASEQMQSATQMSFIARELAGLLGVPANGVDWPTEDAVSGLLNVLNGGSRARGIASRGGKTAKTS